MKSNPRNAPIQTDWFAAFLETVAKLPPFDPAWQEIDQLVDALYALQKENAVSVAAEADQRARLAAAMADLLACDAAQLTFFGIDPHAAWSSDALAPVLLDAVTLDVSALTAILNEHAVVEEKSRSSLAQRRTLSGDLTRLERDAEALWTRLAPHLISTLPPAEAPSADTETLESDAENAAPNPPDPIPEMAPATFTPDAGDDHAVAELPIDAEQEADLDDKSQPVNDDVGAQGFIAQVADRMSGASTPDPSEESPSPAVAENAGVEEQPYQSPAVDPPVTLGESDGTEPEPIADSSDYPLWPETGEFTVDEDGEATPYREESADDTPLFVTDLLADLFADLPVPVELTATPPDEPLTESTWTAFFWWLLGEGDLAAAYWLARSLAEQPEPLLMPLPDWQLAAIQGAWWLPAGRGALVNELTEIVYENTDIAAPWAAVAAALAASLTYPGTGLSTWLQPVANAPAAFNQVVEAVIAFTRLGQPLDQTDVLAVRGEDQRVQEMTRLAGEAGRWLDEAPHRRNLFLRASEVWRVWTGQNGMLHAMMAVVQANDESQTAVLDKLVANWRSISIFETINRTEEQIIGRTPDRKSRYIDGAPRSWLVAQSEEALDVAERWLALAHGRNLKPGWYRERVEELFRAVSEAVPSADADLAQLAKGAPASEVAQSQVLRWALRDLCVLLGVALPGEAPERTSQYYPQATEPGLRAALRFRLLIAPELPLPDDETADPEDLPAVARVLRATIAAGRTPEAALRLHLEKLDLRFAEIQLRNLPAEVQPAWARRIEEAGRRAGAQLERALRKTAETIEQAYVDGLLDDSERADHANRLEAVRSDHSPDFSDSLQRLAAIRGALEKVRSDRLQTQRSTWESIAAKIEAKMASSDEPDLIGSITEYMQGLFERKDTVVIDERLARLRETLDQGNLPKLEEFKATTRRDAFNSFVKFLREWEQREGSYETRLTTILNHVRGTEPPALLGMRNLPKPRFFEVRQTLQGWHKLKRTKPDETTGVRLSVAEILRYLGFSLEDREEQPISVQRYGQDWAYLVADMTAANLSPVPQYGSLHSGSFDVVCLWERPDAEVIGSRLHNLGLRANHVLVVYLGRLNSRRRLYLLHYMREHNLSMLVLDEYQLIYLAREQARLPAFFRCTLPLASVNPYVETGPVAPEMFKGRVRELNALQDEGGYAMVYGGRQLGKSALMQQVEHEFHNPSADRYVIRTDIKPIGDPLSQQADPELIWQRLKNGLDAYGLIPKTSAMLPRKLLDQVRDSMREHRRRRILVLFDEADNFLAADQTRNFEIVSMMRTLMDDTQRRFKVIFAGLHNVQRYEGVPNQPFAHLPGLEIGPLEPLASQQLIRDPLEALGFRFDADDPAAILGILAYTNSHPGLIQLFCQRLLKMLQGRRVNSVGPWLITRQDVEEVYRQREVQEGIRRRFEWTLALDPRYKALAEIMVVEQLEERDGFANAYPATLLRELGQLYWPQAFDKTPLDEFRSYLNEMVGLGVLVRTEQNAYRLRSPNLVRLMGSAGEIKASLDELTQRPAETALAPDSHHAPLDDKASRYSPFTFAQSRDLNARHYGVGLVFGSHGLGIEDAPAALKAHFVPSGVDGKVQEIRIASQTGEALKTWLKQLTEKTSGTSERLIVYRRMQAPNEMMLEQVEAAVDFCRRRQRNQRQWVRVIFLFDAMATQEWLRSASESRQACEAQSDALVILRPWNEIGVSQRLRQHGKLESEKVLRRIHNELGGWPWLLDHLSDAWGGNDDPLPALEALVVRLHETEFRTQFQKACGLGIHPAVDQVLSTIIREKQVPQDLLVPEVLGERFSLAECSAAVEYLMRMGLIQEQTHGSQIDVVPNELFARLPLQA